MDDFCLAHQLAYNDECPECAKLVPLTRLTKENFWNALMEKFPEEMKVFCAWIDEYKRRVGWDGLFRNYNQLDKNKVRYHDLPVAMQLGIFIQFTVEQNGKGGVTFPNVEDGPYEMDDWIKEIKDWFHQYSFA